MTKIFNSKRTFWMSALLPFCEAFEQSKESNLSKMGLVFQYLSSVESDVDELSSLANDCQLKRFLYHIYDLIVSGEFPAPSHGIIDPVYVQILQHLTILSQANPELCDKIAEIAPFNALPRVLFANHIKNDKIEDPQPSHLLSSVRFIAAISFSHKINVTSTTSLHTLFVALFSMLNNSQLAAFACTAISGLAHNCPSANAFIKSLPSFMTLRQELACLLSSSDHSVVLAALSCLTCLFPCREDTETLMRAAIHGIVSPPPYPLSTVLATWSVRDLANKASISTDATKKIFTALLNSCGTRALSITTLINELYSMGFDIPKFLVTEKLLVPVLNYFVHSAHDFVTAAGCNFLREIFSMNDNLSFGPVDEIFAFALSVVVASNITGALLRLESLLILLRMMMRQDNVTDYVTKLLLANEDPIFIAFQRQIERNHSFASANFFIFLTSCFKVAPNWNKKVARIVAETQFTALLVHVLTHSETRTTVADAVFAINLIIQGVPSTLRQNALVDTITSGFLYMNKSIQDEICAAKETLESSILTMKKKSADLDEQREKCKNEVNEAKKEHERLRQTIKEHEDVIQELQTQVGGTSAYINAKVVKIAGLKKKVDEQTKENVALHERVEALMGEITRLKEEIAERKGEAKEMSNDMQRIKEENLDRQRLENELKMANQVNEEQRQSIIKIMGDIDTEKQHRREAESALYETSKKLTEMTAKYHENDRQTVEAIDQIKRFEALLARKTERLTATEDINRQLREEIERLEERLQASIKSEREAKSTAEELRARVDQLENQMREHETLYNFIHRVTEKVVAQDYVDDTALETDSEDISITLQ